MLSRRRSLRRLAERRSRALRLMLEEVETRIAPAVFTGVSSAAALQADINASGQTSGGNIIGVSASITLTGAEQIVVANTSGAAESLTIEGLGGIGVGNEDLRRIDDANLRGRGERTVERDGGL